MDGPGTVRVTPVYSDMGGGGGTGADLELFLWWG